MDVKIVLNRAETLKCLRAAKAVRQLKPYRQKFVDARAGGAAAGDDTHRCLYLVFAYVSDLGQESWLQKGHARLLNVA
jgi:hypothetical protein